MTAEPAGWTETVYPGHLGAQVVKTKDGSPKFDSDGSLLIETKDGKSPDYRTGENLILHDDSHVQLNKLRSAVARGDLPGMKAEDIPEVESYEEEVYLVKGVELAIQQQFRLELVHNGVVETDELIAVLDDVGNPVYVTTDGNPLQHDRSNATYTIVDRYVRESCVAEFEAVFAQHMENYAEVTS